MIYPLLQVLVCNEATLTNPPVCVERAKRYCKGSIWFSLPVALFPYFLSLTGRHPFKACMKIIFVNIQKSFSPFNDFSLVGELLCEMLQIIYKIIIQ